MSRPRCLPTSVPHWSTPGSPESVHNPQSRFEQLL